MNDIEKRLEEIETEHANLEGGSHVVPGAAKHCRICWLVSQLRDTLRRCDSNAKSYDKARASLQDEIESLRTELKQVNQLYNGISGDAATLRIFINEYGMTPMMVVSERDLLRQQLAATLNKEEVEKWKGMSERCGDDAVKRELEFVTVKAQLAQAREALRIAINTVECASLDKDGKTELPWYKAATKALAQKEEK